MFALIFPGQGSQSLGMAKDFYDNFPKVRNIFEEIQDATQINIKDIVFKDEKKQLNITEFTQICIYCASISIFSIIKELYGEKLNKNISFMAGHSLGEYTALAASEVLEIDKCSKLLKLRGKYMQNSYPENKSGMIAVIGLEIEKLESIIQNTKNNKLFQIANHNGFKQIVISLEKKNFDKASLILKEHGAIKTVPLNVSAGFHSIFMEKANNKMNEEIDKLSFNNSKYPIVSNYNAIAAKTSMEIISNLKEQMLNRVKWVDTIKFFEKNNIKNIIEIGPNKVLNGLNRRICSNFTFTNVSNIKELEDLKNVF